MQRSLLSVSGVLLLGLIVLLLNAVSETVLSRFYFDLTEEGLYTLSEGSRNIVDGLKTPMTVRAYISKTDATKFPAIKLYGDRVLSLLREYQRESAGKIRLEVYDPRPDTDEESWAQKYGLTPLTLPTGEKVFFGLAAVNARGEEEVIPVFSLGRQEFLEYDITKAIYSLSVETKPAIGIISSLKLAGSGRQQQMFGQRMPNDDPWVVYNQISQFAEARMLGSEVEIIDPAIKSLYVIHPKALGPKTLYAIDQFVMRGGNLFVAVDPYCNADQPDPAMAQDPSAAMSLDRSSSLKELLPAWGIELVEKKVVGDINLSTKVNTGRGGEPEDFLLWLTVDGQTDNGTDTINRSDILTSQLNQMLFPWAGALKSTNVEGVTVQPLFQTTRDAMLFDESDYRFGGGNPSGVMNKYVRGTEPLMLAARVNGKLKSNFKEPPADLKLPEGTTHLAESTGISHVLVVADADFLADQAAVVVQNVLGMKMVTAINDNLSFAGNVTENLLGSNDLISLRSRGQFTRPFTRVQAIEKRAEERWRMEEMTLQAQLNAANQRLSQLQSGGEASGGGEQLFTSALLDEVKSFREQRAQAQQRLREVRRNLRQDKERLGSWLFAMNTFAVPFALIVLVFAGYRRRTKAA